jgi:hypothetical protein
MTMIFTSHNNCLLLYEDGSYVQSHTKIVLRDCVISNARTDDKLNHFILCIVINKVNLTVLIQECGPNLYIIIFFLYINKTLKNFFFV